jgi:hypothetical protein
MLETLWLAIVHVTEVVAFACLFVALCYLYFLRGCPPMVPMTQELMALMDKSGKVEFYPSDLQELYESLHKKGDTA